MQRALILLIALWPLSSSSEEVCRSAAQWMLKTGNLDTRSIENRTRFAQGHLNRQWQGALWPGGVAADPQEWRDVAPDRAGQTEPERLCRIIQWPVPRQMPQRALVHRSDPGAHPH